MRKFPFRRFIIILALIVLGLFAFYCVVGLAVWHNVATGDDLTMTHVIQEDVKQAMGTNFTRFAVIVSPSRGKSTIHIFGVLSQQEKSSLDVMVDEISHRHGDWTIKILYHESRS